MDFQHGPGCLRHQKVGYVNENTVFLVKPMGTDLSFQILGRLRQEEQLESLGCKHINQRSAHLTFMGA